MTVSFVGAASAEATSLTLPAHQAGDLIVMYARGLSAAPTPPTLPSGWLQIQRFSLSLNSVALCWKIASNNAEVSGTWTNAQQLMAVVYRHSTNYIGLGLSTSTNGTNATSISYPALVAFPDSGWVVGVGSGRNDSFLDTDFDLPPAGMTNRHAAFGATYFFEIVAHDTNANVASWAGATRTNNQPIRYATITAPIVVLNTKTAGGGMLIHPGMSGGMRG